MLAHLSQYKIAKLFLISCVLSKSNGLQAYESESDLYAEAETVIQVWSLSFEYKH